MVDSNILLDKTDVSLSEVFNTASMSSAPSQVTTGVVISADGTSTPPTDQNQIEFDHNIARSNMHSLLQQGQDAVTYALEVAKQSESPRAFEVVGNLMKNLADMNGQLIDLHAKKTSVSKPSETTKVVNNSIVFQGSTSELSKMIQNMRKD